MPPSVSMRSDEKPDWAVDAAREMMKFVFAAAGGPYISVRPPGCKPPYR